MIFFSEETIKPAITLSILTTRLRQIYAKTRNASLLNETAHDDTMRYCVSVPRRACVSCCEPGQCDVRSEDDMPRAAATHRGVALTDTHD